MTGRQPPPLLEKHDTPHESRTFWNCVTKRLNRDPVNPKPTIPGRRGSDMTRRVMIGRARCHACVSNRSSAVDAWLDRYDNPQKPLVEAVRDVVLDADPRVSETIKWQAPTFVFRGNIASFFPKAKAHVALMFHTGASLDDPSGLLEGNGATSRIARFRDDEDLAAKRDALQALIRARVAEYDD